MSVSVLVYVQCSPNICLTVCMCCVYMLHKICQHMVDYVFSDCVCMQCSPRTSEVHQLQEEKASATSTMASRRATRLVLNPTTSGRLKGQSRACRRKSVYLAMRVLIEGKRDSERERESVCVCVCVCVCASDYVRLCRIALVLHRHEPKKKLNELAGQIVVAVTVAMMVLLAVGQLSLDLRHPNILRAQYGTKQEMYFY